MVLSLENCAVYDEINRATLRNLFEDSYEIIEAENEECIERFAAIINEKKGYGMKKFKVRGIILMVIMMMTSFLLVQGQAFAGTGAQNRQVIRIGYTDYEGFIEEKDGIYSGYGVEYLNQIAKSTDWVYEYVYDSWDNQLVNLKNGTVDFVCQAQKTPEREAEYLFSDNSIGSEFGVLYVRENDGRYYYNDYASFNNMSIAVMKNSYQNMEFIDYATEEGFTYKLTEYGTQSECFAALDAGTVDGVAMGSLALKTDYKVICRYGSDPFYFMCGQQNATLLSQLNGALEDLFNMNPYFEADVFEQYYGNSSSLTNVLLTREEQEFIDGLDTINVAFIPNRKPYSYLDEEGNVAGIVPNIVQMIADKIGIDVAFSMMPVGMTSPDYLVDHPDTYIAGVIIDNPLFQSEDMCLSDNFYKDDVVLACQKGMNYDVNAKSNSYVLAIPKSYTALKSFIEMHYPQFALTFANTTRDCLQMVKEGKADFAAQNVNVITPMMSDPHFEGLTVLPTFFMQERMGLVCDYSDNNKMLMQILNKCIATINDSDTAQFTVDHTVANAYTLSLGDMVYKFRYLLIVVVILLAFCLHSAQCWCHSF